MKIPVLTVLLAAACTNGRAGGAEQVVVNPEKSVIVVPAGDDAVNKAAALEFQKHLKRITARDLAIVETGTAPEATYPFFVGIAAPRDDKPLAPEEARWVVTPTATHLFGERLGTRHAVAAFLEDELGVRWIEPGDRGIALKRQSPLVLKAGAFHWIPVLGKRQIRMADRELKEMRKANYQGDLALFEGFRRTLEEVNKDAAEGREWQARMRFGTHYAPAYGHGFSTWWRQYGAAHPEYFAMRPDGKRAPLDNPVRADSRPGYTADNPRSWQEIKLCCSSPALVDQIVQNWLKTRGRIRSINVCENDTPGGPFCTCPECRKLDVPEPGERPGRHLTDRYVYLANAVAREVRKHDPEVRVTMYAYNPSELPPRKQRVEPNVSVAIVPTTFDLARAERLFGGWREAGATELFLRPNLHWYYARTTLPMGFEKHVFDYAQLAAKNGCVGFDFDNIKRNWPTTGMFNYILAKAMSDPSKSYEYWEDHYLVAYGAAAPDVKQYYRHWRTELWEKRLVPAMGKLLTPYQFNFCMVLMKHVGEYYQAADFDRADAILQAGAKRTLDGPERDKLDQLILASQHARLLFNAVTTPMPGKREHARRLLEFRKRHEKDVSVTWIDMFAAEDLTDADGGTGLAAVAERPKP